MDQKLNTAEKPYAGLALLTDLDGTLLTPEKTVSEADAAAIADFRARGGLFSLATGRGVQATQEFLDLFSPDFPAVMYNGALLYDCKAGVPAYTAKLPDSANALLHELTEAFPEVGAEVLNPDGVYVIQDGEHERRHLAVTHVPVVLKTLGTEIDAADCLKALFAGAPEDIARMYEYVADPRFSAVNFTRSHPCFLEILPQRTSKGTALQRLRALLPPGTVIGASGDFDNDIAMLAAADCCGCPADSQESVRKTVAEAGGFCSQKTCADGFFADWIAAFTAKYAK